MHTERVALLVEHPTGDVVAVLFNSRTAADAWEATHDYETVGRPTIVPARSLTHRQPNPHRDDTPDTRCTMEKP